MFDIFAKLLSTVATFLFPVFASYKALNTSDPALLKPWLMYWVVLACVLLAESWTEFILVWIPFYAWIRAGFLLYLIAPQTQGAKILYQEHVHPFLRTHETAIDDFISSAHERGKAAGLTYLKRLIELVKEQVLGLPPTQPSPPPTPATLSYTQSLLARFNLPSARPAVSSTAPTTSTASDFYTLLASAVTAATAGTQSRAGQAAFTTDGTTSRDLSNSGTLIPPSISVRDRMSFITAQRERLKILLSALDREASQLSGEEAARNEKGTRSASNTFLDGMGDELSRPVSAMSKSRSEADFEKIERDEGDEASGARPPVTERSGSWLPWSWGGKAPVVEKSKGKESDIPAGGAEADQGKSSGVELQ